MSAVCPVTVTGHGYLRHSNGYVCHVRLGTALAMLLGTKLVYSGPRSIHAASPGAMLTDSALGELKTARIGLLLQSVTGVTHHSGRQLGVSAVLRPWETAAVRVSAVQS